VLDGKEPTALANILKAGLAVKDIYLYSLRNENFAATFLGIRHRNWAAVAKASSGVP
jgi:hypothetical protein